jgi:hypothetical protein
MFLIKDTYATVWTTEDKGKFVKGRISTSEKNKETNKYINSNWNCVFVGKAKDKATSLKEKDRIKILSGKLSTSTTEDKKTFTNLAIFDFDIVESKNATTTKAASEENEDDNFPF